MSALSHAFFFEQSPVPSVLAVARTLAAQLEAGGTLNRTDVTRCLTEHFFGSDADGRWSVRDAHAALELAQILILQTSAHVTLTSSPDQAGQFFAELESRVPAQSSRSEEQIEWQQFATPPRLAWLAARACSLRPAETVLEPSAGTGMLAVWAAKAEARLVLNEISPLRRDCLWDLFPGAAVSGYDGELINELLDHAIAPSAVLINPPYSHGIERGHDSRTGARHLRSAWNRLQTGGRLVAIMPEWFDCRQLIVSIKGPITLRLNAVIERAFTRQGTTITTRLVVLDKVQDEYGSVAACPADFAALAELVDALPARTGLTAASAAAPAPPRVPFHLVAAPRLPLPVPATQLASKSAAIAPLPYRTLDEPAPIEAQVGRYLPYRPSRIVIEGAAAHPTPLVESVAMGSIAAPARHAKRLCSSAASSMARSVWNSRAGPRAASTGTRPKAASPRSSASRPGYSSRSRELPQC